MTSMKRTATDAARELNASDPLGSMANGSYWPELPPDSVSHFLVEDGYRRPRDRGRRAQQAREVRANVAMDAARYRQVGR